MFSKRHVFRLCDEALNRVVNRDGVVVGIRVRLDVCLYAHPGISCVLRQFNDAICDNSTTTFASRLHLY